MNYFVKISRCKALVLILVGICYEQQFRTDDNISIFDKRKSYQEAIAAVKTTKHAEKKIESIKDRIYREPDVRSVTAALGDCEEIFLGIETACSVTERALKEADGEYQAALNVDDIKIDDLQSKVQVFISFTNIQSEVQCAAIRARSVIEAIKRYQHYMLNFDFCSDQSLLDLYYQIAKKCGIEESNVPPLFVMKSDCDFKGFNNENIHGVFSLDRIAISKNRASLSIDNPHLIETLAHELEHYRQKNKYAGSYHGDDSVMKETGADAAAAGYVECYQCLRKIASCSQEQQDSSGYFCQDDYLPYLIRAKEEGCLCQMHAEQEKQKE